MDKMISIQCDDGYLYDKNRIWAYLVNCYINNVDAVVDYDFEGGSAETNGLYALLDSFCRATNYEPARITIRTANMVESNNKYTIKRCADYWFEIPMIKQWLEKNPLEISYQPYKHFGCFTGQSRWFRLWVATWLNQHYKSKTIMTYHGGLQKNYRTSAIDGVYDWTGLEELNQYGCDIIPEAAEFLKQCPKTLDDDVDLINTITNMRNRVGYPLDHPVTLNLARFYNDFFVDIVMETNATGNVFFLTEKTWRPIISKRPFIIVGSADSLHNLRKLGFQTFYDFWDEEYDCFSNQDRIQRIIPILDKIASWSTAQLAEKLEHMHTILEHNYKTFMQLDFNKIEQVFNE